jgi:hypothetical protein
LRVRNAHELLHGIIASFLDDDGPFPPNVEHVFDQKVATRKRRVKVSHITKKLPHVMGRVKVSHFLDSILKL